MLSEFWKTEAAQDEKLQVLAACVKPMLTYGLELLPLTESDESTIASFYHRLERKVTRTSRANRYPANAARADVIGDLHDRTLKWVGHIQRSENSLALVQLNPGDIGSRGRPLTTYIDYVNRILDAGVPLLEKEIQALCKARMQGF